MGIEMNESNVCPGRLECARSAKGDRVLSTEERGNRSAGERMLHGLLDAIQPAFAPSFLSGNGFHTRLGVKGQIAGPAAPVRCRSAPAIDRQTAGRWPAG